jgi:hypothetical protein
VSLVEEVGVSLIQRRRSPEPLVEDEDETIEEDEDEDDEEPERLWFSSLVE